jgi:hypothetical protein
MKSSSSQSVTQFRASAQCLVLLSQAPGLALAVLQSKWYRRTRHLNQPLSLSLTRSVSVVWVCRRADYPLSELTVVGCAEVRGTSLPTEFSLNVLAETLMSPPPLPVPSLLPTHNVTFTWKHK